MAEQPPCVVVFEACGSASYWAREMGKLGHEARLIAPQYVRPFVKRQKNDAADAEAIVIAAQRPEMRFVELKTEEQQARAVLFRARERLVHQRTELVNALRGILYEFGHVVPQGIGQLKRIEAILEPSIATCPCSSAKSAGTCWRRSAEKTARIEARTKARRSWQRRPTRRVGCRRCRGSGR
jgi:transposase